MEGNPAIPIARARCLRAGRRVGDVRSRPRFPVKREGNQEQTAAWNDVDAFLLRILPPRQQGEEILRTERSTSSPSVMNSAGGCWRRFPTPAGMNTNRSAGTTSGWGRASRRQALRVHYHLDQAKIILGLDADPLSAHPAKMKHARDFKRGRVRSGHEPCTRWKRIVPPRAAWRITGWRCRQARRAVRVGLGGRTRATSGCSISRRGLGDAGMAEKRAGGRSS